MGGTIRATAWVASAILAIPSLKLDLHSIAIAVSIAFAIAFTVAIILGAFI